MADIVDRIRAVLRWVETGDGEIPKDWEFSEDIDGGALGLLEVAADEIERLREENRHFRAATVAAMTLPSDHRGTEP